MDSSTSQKQMNSSGSPGPADAPKLDSRHRFKLLEDCRELVLEKLSAVITKALEKMADELTVEALKATRSDRQRALLDAVMLVREQRKSLEQNFRRYFGDIFERRLFANPDTDAPKAADVPLDELSLVSDQVISDKIDVDRLIQRARSRLDPNEVLGIRARLGALLERDWFEEANHPASPEAIYEALRIAVNELAPSADVRNALLAAFEPHVSSNLNSVYSSLNVRLVANQVLPKIRPRVGRPSSENRGHAAAPGAAWGAQAGGSDDSRGSAGNGYGPAQGGQGGATTASSSALMELGQPGSITMSSSGMAALQQALMRASLGTPEGRGDAARMLSDPGMFGMADLPVDPVKPPLVESLTQVQREVGSDERYRSMPSAGAPGEGSDAIGALMVMELLPLLLQKVKEEGTPLDQMTVELVSVVFDYIYADKALAETVKHQLLRLQVVAVKAALLDRSFFARRQHPMRQLIDRITQLAADPDADLGVEAPLVKGLAKVIDQVIAEFSTDLSSFLAAIDRIDELHQHEIGRRSAEIATQLKAAEREEAYSIALEEARGEVAVRLDHETPTFIREFLLRWWTPVIARSLVESKLAAASASTGSGASAASAGSEATGSAGASASPAASAAADQADDAPAAGARKDPEAGDQKALRVAEFLIWSVAPKHPEEISRLAALLPKLIRALSEGARAVEVPAEERTNFMQELLEAHARVIESAKQWQSGQPDPRPMTVRLRSDGSVRFARNRRERRAEAETISVGDTALSAFERGDRIELIGDSGASSIYKLAWISPARKLFILSRYPKETLTFNATDFAALVSCAKARIVEGTATVDQAIGELTREGGVTSRVH